MSTPLHMKRSEKCIQTQGVVLAGTRQLRSQGPVSVNAHRTEGVTGCVGRQEMNGVMGGIKVGGRNGDGNGVGGGNGHGHVNFRWERGWSGNENWGGDQ